MISLRKPGNLILVYWKDTLQACLRATNIPLKYRIWAVLNGFNPEAAWFKRITKSNKKDFLTDHTYYKTHHIMIRNICIWLAKTILEKP